ncbi:MAG: DUF3137 domain-containing protein [Pseudomonadota bacterium]
MIGLEPERIMSIELPSSRPEFADMPAFYKRVIVPYLLDQENERIRAVTLFVIVGLASPLGAVAVIYLGNFGELGRMIGIMGAMGGFAAASYFLNRARCQITNGLFQRISQGLDLDYSRTASRPDSVSVLRERRLLPNFNKENWEDRVSGERLGANFEICEGKLQMEKRSGRRRHIRTVFHGQLAKIAYPVAFEGETVIRRDRGPLNAMFRPGKKYSRIGLASPEFEKAFEAWSTDQMEARLLLDPIVLERFQELERLFDGKNLRAVFVGGELLLAIETGDKLNMGSMFTPLNDPARVNRILKEFDVIFDLIDVLVKRFEMPIDGPVSVEAVRAQVVGGR